MTTDYIAAATAIAETPAAPADATAGTEPKLEGAPTGSTPPAEGSAPAAAPAAPVSRIEKSFENLAKEKVALRAEREELREYKALADAKKSKSAMALLAASGISWADAAREVLASGGVEVPEGTEAPDPRDARLAALEKEIADSKSQKSRAEIMEQFKAHTKAAPDRFKFVSGFEAEGEAISYVEHYYKETGELPGSSFEESMEIALEAVEAHYAKEAKRWTPLLTPGSQNGSVSGKLEVPAVGAVSQKPRTLTNNVGSGPTSSSPGSKKPKTDTDYQRLAIEALTAQ